MTDSKKRILMVIPFFPPSSGGGVFRPLSFVKYLSSFGWEPTVITPESGSFWINDSTLSASIPEGCEIVRTKTMSGQKILSLWRGLQSRPHSSQKRSSRKFAIARRMGSCFLIPDSYIGWKPFAVHEAKKAAGKKSFDAIYSTSPPETSHLIGYELHKHTGSPWIADFRDPWMNLHLYKPPTVLHELIHKHMERSVVRNSCMVVTSRWHYDETKKLFPSKACLKLIPNGYDQADMDAAGSIEPGRNKFRILHAGMLTQKRTAVPFLKGLRLFIDRLQKPIADMDVLFLGAREDYNEQIVKELGLEKFVEFRDGVGHDEALRIARSSHVLLLLKHMDNAYDGIVPGKLYEYIGLCRPVLGLVPEGEAKDIISGLKRGITVPQDDEDEIAQAICSLYDDFLAGSFERYDLGARPEFTRERMAQKMAAFIDEVISKRKGGSIVP